MAGCDKYPNDVYRLYYHAYIIDEYGTPNNLPSHADVVAAGYRRAAIEDARAAVLRMIADGTENSQNPRTH